MERIYWDPSLSSLQTNVDRHEAAGNSALNSVGNLVSDVARSKVVRRGFAKAGRAAGRAADPFLKRGSQLLSDTGSFLREQGSAARTNVLRRARGLFRGEGVASEARIGTKAMEAAEEVAQTAKLGRAASVGSKAAEVASKAAALGKTAGRASLVAGAVLSTGEGVIDQVREGPSADQQAVSRSGASGISEFAGRAKGGLRAGWNGTVDKVRQDIARTNANFDRKWKEKGPGIASAGLLLDAALTGVDAVSSPFSIAGRSVADTVMGYRARKPVGVSLAPGTLTRESASATRTQQSQQQVLE